MFASLFHFSFVPRLRVASALALLLTVALIAVGPANAFYQLSRYGGDIEGAPMRVTGASLDADDMFRVIRAPAMKWMRFGKRAPNAGKWMRFGKRSETEVAAGDAEP